MRKVDPQKHEAKRRQILEAAAACFADKGFHRTTTSEICAAVGMSTGNIFHYFPTKSAIIEAIVEEEGRSTAAYFEGLRDAPDLFAELLSFMDIILGLAGDPGYLKLALEIAAEALRDERVGALATRNDAELQAALAALLARAAVRGEVNSGIDPVDAARWLGVLIDGVFSRAAVDPTFKPLNERGRLRLLITRFLRPSTTTS